MGQEDITMKDFPITLARLRKEKKFRQSAVAAYVSEHTKKQISFRAVSYWETGVSLPSAEQFLVLCEMYGITDVVRTFYGVDAEYPSASRLNDLGKSRVEEYIHLLASKQLFSEPEFPFEEALPKFIKLFDIPAAAGTGNFLDSDSYEDFEVDDTIPQGTDFAIKVSGNSMMPRFVDGQVAFVKSQQWVDNGEIGVFALNGDSYIKKMGYGELISLNPQYEPITLGEMDSLYIFGKVLG